MELQVEAPVHLVTIHVNDQPVNVAGPKRSGIDIKQAAIAQGVQIQLDFALSELVPEGGTRSIGNDDVVTVTKNSRFSAIDVDDNS